MNMSSTQDGIAGDGFPGETDTAIGGIRGATTSARLHRSIAPPGSEGVSVSALAMPALAMTGACIAVVATASTIKHGSPWAGLNSIAAGLGLAAARPSRRLDPVVTLAGIGIAVGGSVILAGIHHFVSRRVGRGRLLAAALTSVAAVTLDKLFMRDEIFPAFANALGVSGTVAKYGAIGAAGAFAAR